MAKLDHKRRKFLIWQKSGGVCAHCGNTPTGKNKTIDHYVPKSFGGSFDQRNLMPLCKKCNKMRMCNSIDARDFYRYASEEAIEDCLSYEREFENKLKTLNEAEEEKRFIHHLVF